MICRRSIVIGRRDGGSGEPWTHFIPLNKRCSCRQLTRGSGKPLSMWRDHTALRYMYTLMDEWWRLSANSDAKRMSDCSSAGTRARHQVRSRWNSRFSRMGWSSRLNVHNKLIIRWRNVLPWGAILQTWWSWPIRDSSSHRLQKRLADQDSNSAMILSLFSTGSRAYSVIESSSIPRMDRHVVGPSSLRGWRGRPRMGHSWMHACKL